MIEIIHEISYNDDEKFPKSKKTNGSATQKRLSHKTKTSSHRRCICFVNDSLMDGW